MSTYYLPKKIKITTHNPSYTWYLAGVVVFNNIILESIGPYFIPTHTGANLLFTINCQPAYLSVLLPCVSCDTKAVFAWFRLVIRDLHCAVATWPLCICVIRQEFWCLFRCWPPAPVPLYHSILKSESTYCVSCISGFITATVTVLVWTLPLRSVGGQRCILWPPDSFSKSDRSVPVTSMCISPGSVFIIWLIQPTRLKWRWYAWARSAIKILLSRPPSAARISIIRLILVLFIWTTAG